MDDITTATVTVMFHSGRSAKIEHVDADSARKAWIRFYDWAGIGGMRNTRDEWPDGVALELITERGDRYAVPYAAIAMLSTAEEVAG
jgi:hypothetical protein